MRRFVARALRSVRVQALLGLREEVRVGAAVPALQEMRRSPLGMDRFREARLERFRGTNHEYEVLMRRARLTRVR